MRSSPQGFRADWWSGRYSLNRLCKALLTLPRFTLKFSGHAGRPIFNHLNKAFNAASTAAAVRRVALQPSRGSGGGWRGNTGSSRGGGKGRDLSHIQCHGYEKYGHYRSHCPDEAAAWTCAFCFYRLFTYSLISICFDNKFRFP